MLVINRKQDESIILDGNIEITILGVKDGRVKIGIDAPSDVSILRSEIYIEVMEENKKSAQVDNKDSLLDILKNFKNNDN